MRQFNTLSLRGLSLSLFTLTQVAATTPPANFNRGTCLETLTTYPPDSPVFLFGSTPQNPIISIETCHRVCGAKTAWFPDSFPRLNTWLLPVIILLVNLQYPPISGRRGEWIKARFAACVHVLADPSDFTFSLFLQTEAWRRYWCQARRLRPKRKDGQLDEDYEDELRSVAILLAAFDRMVASVEDVGERMHLFQRLYQTLRISEKKRVEEAVFERGIANHIVVTRSNSLATALLAVLFYAWQVAGALVPYIGGSPNPSGGRIAYALFLSWIVFLVLFSNTVGEFTSNDTFTLQIRDYLSHRDPTFGAEGGFVLEELIRESFCCTPSRRHSAHHEDPLRERNPGVRLFISSLPVYVAVVFSVVVTSLPPTYLSVRHFLILPLGLQYIFAPWVTRWARDRGSMWWLMVKDTIVALAMVLLLILASCGIFFNNCEGWRPIYPHGMGVAINPQEFNKNEKMFFPVLISLCLGMQMGFWLMMWAFCSRGLEVMRYCKERVSKKAQRGVGIIATDPVGPEEQS